MGTIATTTSSILSTDKLIATIDSDIASISNDDFKTVFLGCVVVMFGGLLSTLVVGLILKTNNGYGRVIAESYPDEEGAEEEFLRSLPEAEREEAKALLQKLREEKEMKKGKKKKEVVVATTTSTTAQEESMKEKEVEKDMFSDY